MPGYTHSPPLCASRTHPRSPGRYRPGENAKCRKCGRSGAGVRTAALFRDLFQGADPITSDQYCRVPRIRAAASARVSIGANAFAEFCRSVLPGCVPGVPRSDHIRSIRSGPRRPEGCESCTGRAAAPFPLGAEPSRAGRPEGVRVFSGTAGTCRVRVRNPGALRGRLGGGVVAYVPLIRALVTLSRAPRETALYPVHCSPSSLPGRYASAAYPPAGGGTTGNMARIPGGGVPGMLRYVAGRPRRSSSVRCFGMVRHASLRGDTPYWLAMARYDTPGVRRYASVCVGSGCPV